MIWQGWTQEKIKLHLERGYVPDLEDEGYSFDFDDDVDDIILIQVIYFKYISKY